MEQNAVNSFNALFDNMSSFGKQAQAIASEFAKMSEENLSATTKAAERLRGATSLRDVASIQTDLVKESYECTMSHYRKIAEIAATTPQVMAHNYREIFSVMTEAGQEAANRAADMTRQAGERTANVVQKSVETARSAAEGAQRGGRA
jgi:hypothetical protein